MTPKRSKGIIAYLMVAVLLIFLAAWMLPRLNQKKPEHTYSEIMQHFDDLEVTQYTLDLGTGELKMKLQDETEIEYEVPNVQIFKEETEGYRLKYNSKHKDAPLDQDYYKITDNSWLITYVPTLIILVMGIALFIFMMRQAGGGRYNNFGKTNIKTPNQGKKAMFKDVAGAEEEKFEMEEIVDFLKNPRKYNEIGARIPKGVLLLGPPGTVRHCLQEPLPVRQDARSTRSPVRISLRCSLVSAHRVSVICSRQPRRTLPRSSSSTRSTLWDVTEALVSAAVTTSVNRP